MRGHDSIKEFKDELALLRTKLLLCRGEIPKKEDPSSIQVCEQILDCLQYYERPQSALILYQLQIRTCIEQIDDNLIWARSQMIYIVDFCVFADVSNTYQDNCNEDLIQSNRKVLQNLAQAIP